MPLLLVAYWLVFFAGYLWRRAIEDEAGVRIRAIQEELGGTLMPTWRGFRLELHEASIEWCGTLRGPETRLQRGDLRLKLPGLRGIEDLTQEN